MQGRLGDLSVITINLTAANAIESVYLARIIGINSSSNRVQDKTQIVVNKAQKICLPLSLNFRAREAFFAHYVKGDSRYWEFLEQAPCYYPNNYSDDLIMANEAVSLAYLWHHIGQLLCHCSRAIRSRIQSK